MVSVIIPVYNTGIILDKCLKSVLSQTYKDWECIVVNDFSTDKQTVDVLRRWKQCQVPRFLFIDKGRNEGVDAARFTALAKASGDYITFLDSDDWLNDDSLAILVKIAKEKKVDMVTGRMCKAYFGGLLQSVAPVQEEWMGRLIEHEELMDKYYVSFFGVNILPVNLCASLFKRDLFTKACMKPSRLKFGEDLLVCMSLFPFVERYYAVDAVVYNYRIGMPGSSDKYLDSWLENARSLYERKMNVLCKLGNDDFIRYQKIELVNFLKTYVNGCIKYRRKKRNDSIEKLEEELKYKVYQSLTSLLTSPYGDKEAVRVIIKGDANGFYALMEERHRRLPLRVKALNLLAALVASARKL